MVLPVRVYARYNAEGNTSEEDFVGVKFLALPSDGEVVGPEFYLGIEEHRTGELFDTPEAAISDFESR